MFYTYLHRRESDNKPFYIGKGQGKRAWAHSSRNPHWKNTVAKHGLKVEVCAEWPTENAAFEHERFLIDCFRDLGHNLVNLTEGGEGKSGCVDSPETRKKKSLSQLCLPSEVKKMRVAAAVFGSDNPLTRSKKSRSAVALNSDPAVRARKSADAKRQFESAEARAESGARLDKLWADPGFAKRISERMSMLRWANNGVVNKRLDPSKDLSDGFVWGKLPNKPRKQKVTHGTHK
jgi:hypothetical protein